MTPAAHMKWVTNIEEFKRQVEGNTAALVTDGRRLGAAVRRLAAATRALRKANAKNRRRRLPAKATAARKRASRPKPRRA